MGFSESDSSKCRRHPNQKQIPGVCSSCLNERLSKLSATPHSSLHKNRVITNFTVNQSSSPSPPSSASGTAIKGRKYTLNHLRRNGSKVNASTGMGLMSNGLKKSKSLSCAPLSRNRGVHMNNMNDEKSIDGSNKSSGVIREELEEGDGKKKGGLLKRLMNSTSKKSNGGLMHSKSTMNERSHHAPTMAPQNPNFKF